MKKFVSIFILVCLITGQIGIFPVYGSTALTTSAQDFVLPPPGTMIHLSPEFSPAVLTGMSIHPDNALQFDFLIHKGDAILDGDQKKEEYKKLVKYFLASLTIPDEDQWVNLSPYEKDRIIKDDFGKTEMGRDLLAQDYLLKQITSTLIYPEEGLGKEFWNKIYDRAWKEYHTTNIPVNTFNKVWIVPEHAYVYESGNTAYILKSHLKVMMEEDYLSLSRHEGANRAAPTKGKDVNKIGSQVVREVVIPELEREVNEGKNFANLRQMYSGMVLATWYKKSLKESLLGKVYADKAKVKGVDQNPKANEAIYQQYLKAFKKGVFNYIKEDMDKYTKEPIPRKYFSGGFMRADPAMSRKEGNVKFIQDLAQLSSVDRASIVGDQFKDIDKATVSIDPFGFKRSDAAMKVVDFRFSDKGYTVKLKDVEVGVYKIGQIIQALIDSLEQENLIKVNYSKNKKYIPLLRFNPKDFDSDILAVMAQMFGLKPHFEMVSTSGFYSFSIEVDKMEEAKIERILKDDFLTWLKRQMSTFIVSNWFQESVLSSDIELAWHAFLNNLRDSKKSNSLEFTNSGFTVRDEKAILSLNFRDGSLILEIESKASGVDESVERALAEKMEQPMVEEAVSKLLGMRIRTKLIFKSTGVDFETTPFPSQSHSFPYQDPLSSIIYDRGSIYFILPTPLYSMMKENITHFDDDFIGVNGLTIGLAPEGNHERALPQLVFAYPLKAGSGVNTTLNPLTIDTAMVGVKFFNKGFLTLSALVTLGFSGCALKDPHHDPKVLRERLEHLEKMFKEENGKKTTDKVGGIDFNSINLDLQIKRDGKGVPLPLAQQDIAQLMQIQGFEPVIIEIKPASNIPIISELQQKLQSSEKFASAK